MKNICNHCKKESFNQYICDHCKMPINSNWKNNHEIEPDNKKELTIKLDYKMLIAISAFIIALAIAFNAYSNYQEQKQIEEIAKVYTNMLGNVGVQTMDATEQIRKSFETMKNYK